jgi:hypothetical protein
MDTEEDTRDNEQELVG